MWPWPTVFGSCVSTCYQLISISATLCQNSFLLFRVHVTEQTRIMDIVSSDLDLRSLSLGSTWWTYIPNSLMHIWVIELTQITDTCKNSTWPGNSKSCSQHVPSIHEHICKVTLNSFNACQRANTTGMQQLTNGQMDSSITNYMYMPSFGGIKSKLLI